MITVPKYLKPYASVKSVKNDTVSVLSLRCSCGCELFDVYRSYLTREEKKAEKPYYDANRFLYGLESACEYDEEGKPYRVYFLEDGSKKLWDDIIPPKPFFSEIDAVKARCTACSKEITVFDSRSCGYDGLVNEHSKECMEYVPSFKQMGKNQLKLEITIENDPSLDEFVKATGISCSEDFYSNAFSWIQIHGINEEGKKKKLFDSETA